MAEDPIQELVVTPSLEQQTFDSPGGYGPVIIEAVTPAIDSDIRPNNIKKGVSILGVEGSLVGLEGEDISYQFTSPEDHTFYPSEGKNCITSLTISVKNENKGNISPTAFEQRIYPSEGFSGINSATLLPVTAAIDSNIKPENIRTGINILGVQGTLIERISGAPSYTLRSSEEIYMPSGYNCFSQVTIYPQIQSTYSVSPRTSQQVITPSSAAGIGRINLGAVTADIDSNIKPWNIKQGITILGVQGSIVVEDGLNREITTQGVLQMPSSNFSFVLPSTATDIGDCGMQYSFYNCTSLTDIDLSSLTTISGSYGMQYAFYGCTSLTSVDLQNLTAISGVLGMQSAFEMCTSLTTIDLSSLTTISGDYAMQYAFRNCTNLTAIDLSSLTTVSVINAMPYAFSFCLSLTSVDLSSLATISGNYAMQYVFQGCTSLTTIDLPSLTTISGNNGLDHIFYNCTNLTSVDLSSLATISGNYAMQYSFYNCTSLTSVDLSSLTTISGIYGMQYAFSFCSSLTSVDLSSLTTISGKYAMLYAFQGCTHLISLSFPALTSTSFGSFTNQFDSMLYGVTGCKVHFPSNLQSVIGSWSSVTSGFGGTNTTVLFDLPATT